MYCMHIVRLPPPINTIDDVLYNKHGNPATLKRLVYNTKVTSNKDLRGFVRMYAVGYRGGGGGGGGGKRRGGGGMAGGKGRERGGGRRCQGKNVARMKNRR